MKIKILELHSAAKDLDKAPKEVVRSYEIWARLIEVHGIMILSSLLTKALFVIPTKVGIQ